MRVTRRTVAFGVVALALLGWTSLTVAAIATTPKPDNTVAIDYGAPTDWIGLSPQELAGIGYFRKENCASCHSLEGKPRVGPDLASVPSAFMNSMPEVAARESVLLCPRARRSENLPTRSAAGLKTQPSPAQARPGIGPPRSLAAGAGSSGRPGPNSFSKEEGAGVRAVDLRPARRRCRAPAFPRGESASSGMPSSLSSLGEPSRILPRAKRLPEAHRELAVLDFRAGRRQAREHPRDGDVMAHVADAHDEVSRRHRKIDFVPVDERKVERKNVFSVPLRVAIRRIRAKGRGGILLAPQLPPELQESHRTEDLIVLERQREGRDGIEVAPRLLEEHALGPPPFREEGVLDAFRQKPVHDHGIDREAVEAEIHEGPLRLFDDYLLGVRHEPHGRRPGILEERVDAFELLRERLHVREIPVRRERQVGHFLRDRPRDLQDRALESEELLHVPLERGRKRHEPQRFPRGRAIEDQDVEGLLSRVLR